MLTFSRAMALRCTGSVRAARELLEDLIEATGASGMHAHLAHLGLGEIALDEGNVEAALEHLEQAGATPADDLMVWLFGYSNRLLIALEERGVSDERMTAFRKVHRDSIPKAWYDNGYGGEDKLH